MRYKYISDLHLFDNYSFDWRPQYNSLTDFADELLSNWNVNVDPSDTIIIVGDIGHYCPRTVEVLQNLTGIKILVKGNHDLLWGRNLYDLGIFAGVHDYINLNGIHIQHIPDESVNHSSYYIHGHHHRYDMPGMYNALKAYYRDTYRLNCCTDLIGNKPVTLQELIVSKELMLETLRTQYTF